VEALPGASVNDRKATCVRVAFPLATAKLKACLIRVFIDDELQLPTRYEYYEWPRADGAAPVLMEEYTYLDVRLNPGFTDADFDPKNKHYAFP
jgi:outer membrane lipoprotein-sorting protein